MHIGNVARWLLVAVLSQTSVALVGILPSKPAFAKSHLGTLVSAHRSHCSKSHCSILQQAKASDAVDIRIKSTKKSAKPRGIKGISTAKGKGETVSTKKGGTSKIKSKNEAKKATGKKETPIKRKRKPKNKKIAHWIEDSDLAVIDVDNSSDSPSKEPVHVRFKVHGNPLPLRRHRTARGFMYNPSAPAQASFRNATLHILNSSHQLKNATNETSLHLFQPETALVMSILFRMKRPNLHFVGNKPGPGRLRETAPPVTAQTRTDVDNLAKFVLDSLNGLLYEDDRQICSLHVTKLLDSDGSCQGSTEISCRPLEESDLSALKDTFFDPINKKAQ